MADCHVQLTDLYQPTKVHLDQKIFLRMDEKTKVAYMQKPALLR